MYSGRFLLMCDERHYSTLQFRCCCLVVICCCCCYNYAFKSSIKRAAIIKYLKLLAVRVARVERLANSYVLARMLVTSCSVKQIMCSFITKESSSFTVGLRYRVRPAVKSHFRVPETLFFKPRPTAKPFFVKISCK